MAFGGKRRGTAHSRRIATAVAVLLLCFQLVRAFVVLPIDAVICLNASEESADHSGHQHGIGESRPADSGGASFQHCKDTELGGSVNPELPFGLSAPPALHMLQVTWAARTADSPVISSVSLAPPFEPPRA